MGSFRLLMVNIQLLSLLGGATVYSAEPTYRERIINRIDQVLNDHKNALIEFQKQIKEAKANNRALQYAVDPQDLLEYAKDQQERLMNLRTNIINTSDKDLPAALVDLYVNHKSFDAYPELGEYIMELGDAAVPALTRQFSEKSDDFFKREKIIYLLGRLKFETALPTVRVAIKDLNLRVSFAGMAALRMIRSQQSIEEFHALLDKAQEPEIIENILRELALLGDPDRCGHFWGHARQGRIALARMTVDDLNTCTEEDIGEHIEFLIKSSRASEQQTARTAAQMIAKLKDKKNLKKVYPIFSVLIKARNQIGGEVSDYGASIKNEDSPMVWASLSSERDALLDRITQSFDASDIGEWLNENSEDKYTAIYLKNLLLKKNGFPELKENTVDIEIDVQDYGGQKICGARSGLVVNSPLTVTCAGYHVDMTLSHVDIERGRIKLNPVLVDLKPHAVGFSAEIPMGGSYVIKLSENGQTYIWKFKNNFYDRNDVIDR